MSQRRWTLAEWVEERERRVRKTDARCAEALRLRFKGLKLHEIGAELGVTKQRAGQMVWKAVRLAGVDPASVP
jgi:DNA-directed RNA polymerase sigma subunit (sigma70/sigma32)